MNNLNNILAIDLGEKFIGLAIAFQKEGIILPLNTLIGDKKNNLKKLINIIKEKNIGILLIGDPQDSNGNPTKESDKVYNFCKRVQKRCNVVILLVPEYGSTKDAKEKLSYIKGRYPSKKAKNKGLVDSMSAVEILKRYIDNKEAIQFKGEY